MSDIPEHQKDLPTPPTNFNQSFAATAAQLKPKLHEWSSTPQRLVKFEHDENSFFKIKPCLSHTAKSLPSLLWGKSNEFILDFGIHLVGYLSFNISGNTPNIDAPARLRLVFGETPRDVAEELYPCLTWISTSWLPDEIINIEDFPSKIEIPRRRAFRYVRIQVIDTSLKYKVAFDDVSVRTVSAVSPSSPITTYQYSNDMLRLIDNTCIFTLRDCMQSVFEDGPRRDRRLWIGDLRLQALANYATIKDYNLVKRCLYQFAALSRIDGSLPACLFENKSGLIGSQDYIVDYDALYALTVYDYVAASGDYKTGRELFPTLLGCMKIPLRHINELGSFDGKLTPYWKFMDWSKEAIHTDAGEHGLVLLCCKAVNKLATMLGIEQPFADIVRNMTMPKALSPFYDKECQMFVSGPTKQVSMASAAWLTISEAFDRDVCKTALLNAIADRTAIVPQTPYLFHYVAEALAVCGAESEALNLILDYWGGMIQKAQADTFWECFDPANPRASPYGDDCQNNSFCHAWSCTPSYLLRGRLAEYAKAASKGEISMEALDRQKIEANVT